nr:uncharacterized protein LOC123003430 [Drosophila takahashii]
MDYGKSLYKTVEVTGSPDELVLMRVVGDLVKHMYFKYYPECVQNVQRILRETMRRLVKLEHATLNFSCPVPLHAFEAIIRTLEELPNLKGIGVFQNTDVLDGLRVYDDSNSLLKDCQIFLINDNLRTEPSVLSNILILKKMNNSFKETLGYIVPHLSSVEEMIFYMSQPSKDYQPLARVSKLQKIGIYEKNNQNSGPHLPFIAGLASGLSRQLTELSITTLELCYDEAKEISRMVNLRELHCCFEEPRCLEHLPALKQLKYLSIRVSHSGVTNQLLAIIRGCTRLNVLLARVNSSQLSSDFILRALEVLRIVRDPGNQKPLRLGTPSENQIRVCMSKDLICIKNF